MRNFPKHLNSKFDYEYIRQHFPEEKWKPHWEKLLAERKQWYNVGVVEEGQGIEDETHRVETYGITEGEEKRTELHQLELRDDPSAPFFRLGFTEAEVKEALEE